MRLSIQTLKKIEAELGEFDVSQVLGGNNDVYLRFGYWKRINPAKLQEIVGPSINVVEDDLYDDDCGWLYSYKMLEKF
jgi:hypothetical protein